MTTADGTQRLFIAVAVPEALQSRLRGLNRDIARRHPHCRQFCRGPTNFHLTLRFLGETPPVEAASVRAALLRVEAGPFDLAIRGLGLFGRGGQGVLWAGLKPCPALGELKQLIDAALAEQASVAPPGGAFSPHVTLARLKGPASVLRPLVAEYGAFALPPFPVTAFGLYSSVLTPGGAAHALEQEYPLAGISRPAPSEKISEENYK